MAENVRWLSYDELADVFGIARESSRRLVIRKHWARRQGNDGKARVAVPIDAIPADVPPSDTADAALPVTVDVTGTVVAALEEHIATLKNVVEAERARSETLVAVERARADTFAKQLEALRQESSELTARRQDSDEQSARLEQDIAHLRAIVDAMQATKRPWWRRLAG